MIISKPLAAILGFIPKGCAHQPQPDKQALANEVKEYRAKEELK